MSEWIVISDIHANYPALEAVVEKEGKDKNYIVLGDIIGLYGYPQETVETVREISTYALAGNHDVAVLEYGEGHTNDEEYSQYELNHTVENLSQDQNEWVNGLGTYGEVEIDGKSILLTHAKPYLEESAGYKMGNAGIKRGDEIEYAAQVDDKFDYVLYGHTHEPCHVDCSKFNHNVVMINPGSLAWDSTYATVNFEDREYEIEEVEYDKESMRQHIKEVAPKIWW